MMENDESAGTEEAEVCVKNRYMVGSEPHSPILIAAAYRASGG